MAMIVSTPITIRPETASLFLRSRRHASLQSPRFFRWGSATSPARTRARGVAGGGPAGGRSSLRSCAATVRHSLAVPHARIDHAVEQVNEQIREHQDHRVDERRRHDDGVIALLN